MNDDVGSVEASRRGSIFEKAKEDFFTRTLQLTIYANLIEDLHDILAIENEVIVSSSDSNVAWVL